MKFTSDYFYGNESEQFTFYRIPKVLITEPHFKNLTADAKILYGLMLDRMGLSIKNNWKDEHDKVYIYFTLEDIQEYMNCGHTKGVKIIAELDSENGVGLIERIKQGQGKPTKIYVKKFISNDENFSYPQKNERTQDFPKSEVKTSANEKSRLPQSRSADFHNADTNYNDFINKDFNDIDINSKSMSSPNSERETDFDNDDDVEADTDNYNFQPLKQYTQKHIDNLEARIKEQINYDWLITRLNQDEDEINSFVFIILDTLLSNNPTIRVNGEDKPQAVVKSMLSKVTNGSILYAINKFKEQKHEIKHKKSYLLTCLYNAQIEGVYNGINYLNRIGR